MLTHDLAGKWFLSEVGNEDIQNIPGNLPGCNYLDLLSAEKLHDPFYGLNEYGATKKAESDYRYATTVSVSESLLQEENIDLVFYGLDTLAELTLNGKIIAETNNAHRLYRIPVKELLQQNGNTLSILLRSPVVYVRQQTSRRKIPSMVAGEKGISHLRKPQYHFGWDWGPTLPPSGLAGFIRLEGYSHVRITDVEILQAHEGNAVHLTVDVNLEGVHTQDISVNCSVTAPNGESFPATVQSENGKAQLHVSIPNPQLWWCNGLGEQPLYTICVTATHAQGQKDIWERNIGLRTIKLDTSRDEWGSTFRFLINGVPIFAKGANWIPSDSFITRTMPAEIEWYIRTAQEANMNMIRVWGGGYYESDLFYDLCDQYGLLVWQDFGFACALYPLDEPDFVENVRHEVRDNMQRLRHHASLALWCGNNEIQAGAALWVASRQKKLYAENNSFFYETLSNWVKLWDRTTPYWPGSPSSSGSSAENADDLNNGDAHLWKVWHGMKPVEAYRNMPARFCSEFGMESLPSMKAIQAISEEAESLNLFSPVMLSHQKCSSGNAKMLYYLLAKYRNPATLSDFIYLSQLMQAETIRYATEFWRRNMGRCNGSLYWQYNDCWPVASWAGIDYGKQFKALQYFAKRFNTMLLVSADLYPNYAEIAVVNDYPEPFTGTLVWKLLDFNGNVYQESKKQVLVQQTSARKAMVLRYKEYLPRKNWNECALFLQLLDSDGNIVSEQRCLLVPDKQAKLQKPKISTEIALDGETAALTLCSDRYARIVRVEIEGVNTPFSDNYFDLLPSEPYCIKFAAPQGVSLAELQAGLRLHSLVDVEYKGSIIEDKCIRLGILCNPKTHIPWKRPEYPEE